AAENAQADLVQGGVDVAVHHERPQRTGPQHGEGHRDPQDQQDQQDGQEGAEEGVPGHVEHQSLPFRTTRTSATTLRMRTTRTSRKQMTATPLTHWRGMSSSPLRVVPVTRSVRKTSERA